MRSSSVAAALVLAFAAGRAAAGTIDTRAFDGPLSGPDPATLGGTFPADDIHLQSFSLILNLEGGPATIAAQVYATDAGGTPVGGPLYTSGLVVLTAVPTEYTFAPDVFLTPGQHYWIGATSIAGHVAGTFGDYITWVNTDNPLPTGQMWFNVAPGTPTTPFPATDVASLIVMNPEPGTLALFGLGALGLGFAVRRRRARAV